MDSFKLVYSKDINWNKENGYEISYTCFDKNSGLHINITQRFLYNDNRLFVSTYTSQSLKKDIYKATAFAIIDKMRW